MKTAFLAALCAAAFVVTSAHGATIVQSGQEGLPLQLFDPSSGTLVRVEVSFTAAPQQLITAVPQRGAGARSVPLFYSLALPVANTVTVSNGVQSDIFRFDTLAVTSGHARVPIDQRVNGVAYGDLILSANVTGTFQLDVMNFIWDGAPGGAVFLDSIADPVNTNVKLSSRPGVTLIAAPYTLQPMIEFSSLTYHYTPAAANAVRLTAAAVAVPSVPEPSTWAMMIGGFGLVGVAMRGARRKQAVAA